MGSHRIIASGLRQKGGAFGLDLKRKRRRGGRETIRCSKLKKAVGRGSRASLLGRVLLLCYAKKNPSVMSPPMSAAATTTVRPTSATVRTATAATVGGSTTTVTAGRRMAAATSVARSRVSAAVTRG